MPLRRPPRPRETPPDHLSAFSAARPPVAQGTCLSPSQVPTDLSGRPARPHWPFPYSALPVCPLAGSPRALEGVGGLAPADGCARPLSPRSTELMRRLRRFQIAQYKCLMIKYAKDTRYGDSFCTHDRSVPAPPVRAPLPSPPSTCRRSPFVARGHQGGAWYCTFGSADLTGRVSSLPSTWPSAGLHTGGSSPARFRPPQSIWQCLEFVVFTAGGGGACFWHQAGGGQGCCRGSCKAPVTPCAEQPCSGVHSCAEVARTGSLSPPGLSTWAASSEAIPCHMRGSRLRGGGAGGPEPGRRWGGRCQGLAASQVLGTRVTFQAVPSDAGLRTPPSLLPRP